MWLLDLKVGVCLDLQETAFQSSQAILHSCQLRIRAFVILLSCQHLMLPELDFRHSHKWSGASHLLLTYMCFKPVLQKREEFALFVNFHGVNSPIVGI